MNLGQKVRIVKNKDHTCPDIFVGSVGRVIRTRVGPRTGEVLYVVEFKDPKPEMPPVFPFWRDEFEPA